MQGLRSLEESGAGAPRPHRHSPRSSWCPWTQPAESGWWRCQPLSQWGKPENRRNIGCNNSLLEWHLSWLRKRVTTYFAHIYNLWGDPQLFIPKITSARSQEAPWQCSNIFISPLHMRHIWQKNEKFYCLQDFHLLFYSPALPLLLFIQNCWAGISLMRCPHRPRERSIAFKSPITELLDNLISHNFISRIIQVTAVRQRGSWKTARLILLSWIMPGGKSHYRFFNAARFPGVRGIYTWETQSHKENKPLAIWIFHWKICHAKLDFKNQNVFNV